MTEPRLVPFKAEHMLTFVNRDTDVLQEMRFATQKERGGPAFTALLNNKVIGCAGIIVMWPGVGSAWLALSNDIDGHGMWLCSMVKSVMQDTIRALKLHRVEAAVLSDNKRNLKWIKLLGFNKEKAFAYAYTQDKQDVVRFELIVR